MRTRSLILAMPLVLGACASLPKDAGFSDIQSVAATSFPTGLEWPGVTVSEVDANARIDNLLAAPLTEDGIIELAMLSSRKLRGTLYGLKAARGDYVDMASPPNPFVSAVFLDVQGENVTNLEFGAGYELLDLLFLPRRVKMSEAGFEAAKLDASRSFIDFATDVRFAYYEALAAQQMLGLMEQANKAANASANASQALFDAGNIPEVQLSRDKLMAAQTGLDIKRAEQNLISAKESLVRILGLNETQAERLTLKGRLRNPPKTEERSPDLNNLTASSLSLASQDARIEAAGTALGITDITSLIGDLELEFARERDDGEWEAGIGAGFNLPIFNFGQGKRDAAGARLQAMLETRMADTINLSSYVRELSSDLETKRTIALRQRQEVLPLAGKVLQGSQLDYNAMQIGVFGLLNAKREQLAAGQAYIMSLQDYWTARARLDQMIAGGSPTGAMMMGLSMGAADTGGDH